MIITRKIEIKVVNTGEQKTEAYEFLKYHADNIHKLNNCIVNNLYMNDLIQEKFIYHDQVLKEKVAKADEKIKELYSKRGKSTHKLKEATDDEEIKKLKDAIDKYSKQIDATVKDKNKLTTESGKRLREQFKEIYSIQFASSVDQNVRKEFPDIASTVFAPTINPLKGYAKDLWKVKLGLESLKTFKKGMPFNVLGSHLNFFTEGQDVYIKWVRKIVFKIHFGRDKSNNKEVINKVLNGTYKVCDSSIQYGDKIFLNLCVDIPQKEVSLDENMVLGVDLGLAVPAYISTNRGYFRKSLGNIDEFLKIRLQMQKRKEKLQRDVSLARGGHGRTRKLQALNNLQDKERAWVKTYNHKISKAIVDSAIKNQCSVINMEFLKGYGQDETNKFILRNWSYYELQQFIEYKAKKVGIEVAYIDPYHTSQTCSKCGHYEKGQRISQKDFECKSCGFKDNADYNASRNIAKSTAYVKDKSECQYFKLKNK